MADRPQIQGITIDAPHTRDIDDALWFEEVGGGGYRVFISISDVSGMVLPKSELDERARAMATTKYFATGNSPMLPRRLAEHGLSLLPGALRKTMTVEAVIGPNLDVSFQNLYCSKLTSKARVAYEEVPKILASKDHELHAQLLRGSQVAMGLLERRRSAGALALYDLNNGWVTTEEGYLRKMESKEETIGYIIVQEMMVLANALVAEFAVRNDIPVLFRNHVARAAAPDRSELMRQIQSAFQVPLPNLDLIQQQTHLLLEKAEYGASLRGHYGLNLPAYLHFTSPIRRYADLVTHRQLRSFLKKDPLPYSKEEIDALSVHLNQVLQAERDSVRQIMKAKAENKAQATLDERRLEGLNAKDFERVIKVWARSPNEVPEEIRRAYLRRLKENRVPVVCFATVLLEAQASNGWEEIQKQTLARMQERPEEAVSVVMMASQANGWPPPNYETSRTGPDHAPVFSAVAKLQHPSGLKSGGPIESSTSKEARQRAVLCLLANISGQPEPEFDPTPSVPLPVAHNSGKEPFVDWGKDPIMALQEYSQALGKPGAEYKFDVSGPAHMPTITCTCRFGSYEKTASAGKKQDAKRLATLAVISAMGKK